VVVATKATLYTKLQGNCFCNDCGVDVGAVGDWYMCSAEVWERQLGLGWSDNLCIACLVKRLGREPQFWTDIFPATTGGTTLDARAAKDLVPLSKRMLQMMSGSVQITKAQNKKQ
jgi:hypothetical protein